MNTHTKTIIAVLGVCAGVVIGEKSLYGSEIVAVSLFIFASQLGVYGWSKKKISSNKQGVQSDGSTVALITAIFFISLAVGIVRMQFTTSPTRFICETSCTFEARLVRQPDTQDAYQVMDVRPLVYNDITEVIDTVNVRIRVPLYPLYNVGETLTLKGKVTQPKNNPPHEGKKSFDYDSYLLLKHVGSEMFFPTVLLRKESTSTFVESLMKFKQRLVTIVGTYVNEPQASLASGMLLGNAQMSKELTQTFRIAGLSHIVVLSGFNIAILITVLLLLLKPLPLVVRVVTAFVVIIIFVVMVGAEASVVRATLMAFIALVALLFGRGYVAHQALLLSFLGIVLYSPTSLLSDVSLHLSFLATAGIVYMSDEIKKYIESFSLPEALLSFGYIEIVTTTLAAYFATLPYVIYTFGTVSVYGLLANFLVLPLVPLIMLLTILIATVASLNILLASLLGYIVTLLGGVVIWVARAVESLPYASFLVSLSFTKVLMLYLFIIILYRFFFVRRKDETCVTNENEITSGIISY